MHALHKCCAHLAQEPCTRGPARAPLHERFARGSRLATTAPPSALARICTAAPPFARGLCTPCTRALLTLHHDPACKVGGCCCLHESFLRLARGHERPHFARRPRLCTRLLCALHVGFAHFAPRFSSSTALPRVRLHSALFGSTRLNSAPFGLWSQPYSIALVSAPLGCTRIYSAQFDPARSAAPHSETAP